MSPYCVSICVKFQRRWVCDAGGQPGGAGEGEVTWGARGTRGVTGTAPVAVALWRTRGKRAFCLSRAGFAERISQPGGSELL